MSRRHRTLFVLLGIAALTGADWPRFQGPNGDGTSPETGLAREWPADGPPVQWRVKLKPGWSSPSVVGDDAYVCATEEVRGDKESVACLDAKTGAVRWKHEYEVGPYWQRNIGWARGGFRGTPAVAGDRVFTLGAVGHLHCLNRHTGEVVWSQNLWDAWNPSGEKGYVFSPLVVDGKLILWYSDGVFPVQAEKNREKVKEYFVLCRALDPATGKQLWEFNEPHRLPGSMGEGQTPAVADFGGDKCVLVLGNRELKALRVNDGREVWKFGCVREEGRGTTIPTPLVAGRFLVNIPDQDVAHVLELDRTKLDQPPKILWKKELNTYCAIHQFRERDGYLYGFTGEIRGDSEQHASDSVLKLSCLELATGNVKWSEPGFRNGVALTLADGLMFVRSYQTLRLVEATPEGYRVKGEIQTHNVWKPTLNLLDMVQPVLANGRLYVRTPEELICYDVRTSAAGR